VPKFDIHCVSSDGYIASFDLLLISIVFCAKYEYIGSFELNWICIVFCCYVLLFLFFLLKFLLCVLCFKIFGKALSS
jgi:hypothetical protein